MGGRNSSKLKVVSTKNYVHGHINRNQHTWVKKNNNIFRYNNTKNNNSKTRGATKCRSHIKICILRWY